MIHLQYTKWIPAEEAIEDKIDQLISLFSQILKTGLYQTRRDLL